MQATDGTERLWRGERDDLVCRLRQTRHRVGGRDGHRENEPDHAGHPGQSETGRGRRAGRHAVVRDDDPRPVEGGR